MSKNLFSTIFTVNNIYHNKFDDKNYLSSKKKETYRSTNDQVKRIPAVNIKILYFLKKYFFILIFSRYYMLYMRMW